MRDNMYEGMWSPFDPSWYQQAFDKFISTADELFNQDEIINAGYTLPDADGSKSSVFHQNAVTNNSFDESVLRDTLSDIYMNSYHRLTAANHDNVHFFQWHGSMKDVTLVPSTQMCEIRIPTDTFIDPATREKYKFRQFYRKWISVTDLMNNWDTFKFTVLLFINQRIYSEYELRMDDQETVVRFKYYEHWRSNKYKNLETGEVEEYTDEEYSKLKPATQAILKTLSYPIYIYKFDTNAQCRVKVSKELITNQWKWKMPMSYIGEERKLGNVDAAKRKRYNCPTCDTEYVLSNGASIFTDHVMVAFNKISDPDIRTDGNQIVDILGDNLEFLKIENGYLDLTKCSEYNKHMLITEEDQWIWMTITVPKFMHEFPIILPTDVVYRPHVPMYEHVKIKDNGVYYDTQASVPDEHTAFETRRNVYVDLNEQSEDDFAVYLNDDGELVLEYDGPDELTSDNLFVDSEGYLVLILDDKSIEISLSKYHFFQTSTETLYLEYVWDDGWKYTIRPLVLSDAFDEEEMDMYERVLSNMSALKNYIIDASKEVASFHEFIDYVYEHQDQEWTYDDFLREFNKLRSALESVHDEYKSYLETRFMHPDESYLSLWDEYELVCEDILNSRDPFWEIDRFHRQHGKYRDFYSFISPLIYIPDEFTQIYEVADILKQITQPVLWEDVKTFKNQLRFRRPIDASDIWTFEYDRDDQCWRPVQMNIEHRFPDVYLITSPDEKNPTPNRIFKSFIFYSDTANPREISSDMVRATPSWDRDLQEYEFDKAGTYRDIFMEKFYWAGVRTIYKGLLATKNRWECIEYIKDNPNYDRFNYLFLNTMDPYVKMGEATYLKSDNYQFITDDRITKMNEYMKAQFLDYDRITGFEMYLNKSWKPSYFDAIIPIDDTFNPEERLIRRPRSTFDTRRVLRILNEAQFSVLAAVRILRQEVTNIRQEIVEYDLKFHMELLDTLDQLTSNLESNLDDCIEFVNGLDMDIYSIEDINTIIGYIEKHFRLIAQIKENFSGIKAYIADTTRFDIKLEKLYAISEIIRIALHDIVYTLGDYIQSFDMDSFMKGVNNYEYYNDYDHKDDDCLIGAINNFNTAWPKSVQVARNKLYLSTEALWTFYDPDKSYTQPEVEKMLHMINEVKNDIESLHVEVFKCWETEKEWDRNIVDKFEFAWDSINTLSISMAQIVELRSTLFNTFDEVRALIVEATALGIDDKEEAYALDMDDAFDQILYHLSYIAGANRQTEALAVYNRTVGDIEGWIAYVTRTRSVYLRLLSVVDEPNVFLDTLAPYHELLAALIAYMRTVDREFIPDSDYPKYSSVYQVDEIEMINGGFLHEVGDFAFFENLGIYTVAAVDGNIDVATELHDPNLDEIDLSYDAWLDTFGKLFIEVPNTPNTNAYLDDDDLILVVEDDDTSSIQDYRFTVVDGELYMEYPDNTEIYLNDECELIITVEDDPTCRAYIDSDGYLIINMADDVTMDIELIRFFVTSQNDLMMRRVDNVYYRNTTFKDPMWQGNPYDSITSGKGQGIVVEPISSTETKIINDEIVTSYKKRVANLLDMIEVDMGSINPYYNIHAQKSLDTANRIQDQWNELLTFYSDNISPEIVDACNEMMESLNLLTEPIEALIDYRERNNLKLLVTEFSEFMDLCDTTFKAVGLWGPNYIYMSDRVKSKLSILSNYYGDGMGWNDSEELLSILDGCEYELKLFYRQMIRQLPELEKAEIETNWNIVMDQINVIREVTTTINSTYPAVWQAISEVAAKNEKIPDPINVDTWYRLTRYSVAVEGRNYQPGDIVEMIPALPKDIYGNEIHDDEALIMSDRLFFKVTQTSSEGGVIAVKPIMDYALPYHLYGARDTIAKSGTGESLRLMIMSRAVEKKDCMLFWSDDSYIPPVNQYDENDLFTFKFSNIHDLPIGYEVFFDGKQKHDVIIRHEHEEDQLKPRDVDVVYLNANDVMRLADSSVFIEGEEYFIYRLKGLSIADPGAGYYEGQVITVDADQLSLKLKVSEITDDNMKGIADIEMLQNYQMFYGVDPSTEHAEVVTDSMNNIDDEYNSGYYDNIPIDGIIKQAAPPYSINEYPYISKRWDIRKGEFSFEVEPASGDLVLEYDDDTQFTLEMDEDGYVILTMDEMDTIELEYYSFEIENNNLILDRPESIGEYGRNGTWLYPTIDFPEGYDEMRNGDPDDHTYLGTREENSMLGIRSDRWNGIAEVVPVTHSFTPDADRVPYNQPTRGEYQMIKSVKIHKGNTIPSVDLIVNTYEDLPKHVSQWDDIAVTKLVLVKNDETMDHHRMIYRVQNFFVSGYIAYDDPFVADTNWTTIDVKWNEINCFQDLPTMVQQYPSDKWYEDSYGETKYEAISGNIDRVLTPVATLGTYIHNVTAEDISIYNFTLKRWEDPTNPIVWNFTKTDEGFTLQYLGSGEFSYNMILYLNKTSVQQLRNEKLKQNAVFNISTEIFDEVNTKSNNISILIGRQLRFRKLFPYEQKEEYTLLNTRDDHEMVFKLAPYMHYKNEIHVRDITLALLHSDGSLIRFEDVLDNSLYEIQIKDDKAKSRGTEIQTKYEVAGYGDLGSEFINGDAWAWNEEYKIHIFGYVEADMFGDGHLTKFIPEHCVNMPTDDMLLEFKVYQFPNARDTSVATVLINFHTEQVEVYGDGWLHNVTNPYAPISDEFKIVLHYDYGDAIFFQVIINKNPDVFQFIKPKTEIFPTFTIPNSRIPENRLYITTEQGRLPLINPSTGKPSMHVTYTDTDTQVQYLNIYHKYELMEIHVNPYPMRSVFTKRRIVQEGYIDLAGRINKPLNKKYFEFWMNGKLLDEEVTIISPTKIFLHGLKSLRNFEIIEINRDPNEYFSDAFLVIGTEAGSIRPVWNYNTYLDDALEAENMYDTYTIQEQKALLSPVWPQVERDDENYLTYPENLDEEDDILMRIDDNLDLSDLSDAPTYQFTVIDVPEIEGVPIFSRYITFEQFGFKPITEQMIIDMLNEEWAEEIEAGEIPQASIISDEEWYGMAAKMFNEDGNPVMDVNDAAYKVLGDQVLAINTDVKISRIISKPVEYDLT